MGFQGSSQKLRHSSSRGDGAFLNSFCRGKNISNHTSDGLDTDTVTPLPPRNVNPFHFNADTRDKIYSLQFGNK